MTIVELKSKIEENTLDDSTLVFVTKDNNFIAHQYINRIAKNRNLELSFVDTPQSGAFVDITKLFIYETPKLEFDDLYLTNLKNHVIIVNKVSAKQKYSCIVELPQLEKWQVAEYTKSQANGLDEAAVDNLSMNIKDVFRLDNEIQKISIFPKAIQQTVYESLNNTGTYNEFTQDTIFTFSNALFSKDIPALCRIYNNKINCDIEPLGLVTILYKNIRNMIQVAMQKYPTEQNTGLKSNQIYAIKKQASNLTREQLLKLFDFISQIENNIKTGLLPQDLCVDYVITNVLSIIK